MNRLIAFAVALAALVACSDSNAPDPFARKHLITTDVRACSTPADKYELSVSWVEWKWQAIFLKGAQQVASVTDSSLTHSSGCVYALRDAARVKLVPLAGIEQYLDSTFVDVTIEPSK